MFLSKLTKPIYTKQTFLCILQQRKMSIDVIRSGATVIPSLNNYKSNYLNTIENKHLKSQESQTPNTQQNQVLSKVQSYEISSQYTPQVITAKYFKEHEIEEDKVLNEMQRYQLIHYIATLKTPYISIIDTAIDGFNASTSIAGGFRIVTENAKVQLSQSYGIPFYLSRLDGNLGLYLSMTTPCLTGKELLFAGLVTHYIHSSKLNQVEKELQQLDVFDKQSVNQVLNKFSTESGNSNNEIPFGGYRRIIIDSCFKYDTLNEILDALKSNGSAFALKAYDEIQSYDTIDRFLMARSALGFSEYLKKEHDQEISFLNDHDFSCIRHHVLPTEKDVMRYIEDKLFFNSRNDEIEEHFAALYNNKFGVREKVRDIVERKTKRVQVGQVSKLIWCDE